MQFPVPYQQQQVQPIQFIPNQANPLFFQNNMTNQINPLSFNNNNQLQQINPYHHPPIPQVINYNQNQLGFSNKSQNLNQYQQHDQTQLLNGGLHQQYSQNSQITGITGNNDLQQQQNASLQQYNIQNGIVPQQDVNSTNILGINNISTQNNINNIQQQTLGLNNNIIQQPQQQLNQNNNNNYNLLNKNNILPQVSSLNQNSLLIKGDSDVQTIDIEKDEKENQNSYKTQIIAYSNKWINRYTKNSKVQAMLKVPILPEDEDTLNYCDIFSLQDKYIDYEFDLPSYNPQKVKEGEEQVQQPQNNENTTFLNRNKYLLQYILNFLTEENLNLLNLPEQLKQYIIKIVSFIQNECGYNKKKKSFRFTLMSHCHYHILFLKINQKNLREMMKREQDIELHNKCFDLNLEDLRSYYKAKEIQEPKSNGATGISDSQHQQLVKVQYVNFAKMCIHELIIYHVKDHILECAKKLTAKNADKEYEERAFVKIQQMNEGIYMNRF